MTLGAAPGSNLEIICEGERTNDVIEVLRDIFTGDSNDLYFRGTTFEVLDT
jgi:phosphotransferase system HPr-like phosphotransfer protein